jgi:hypothetical protein
MASATRKRSALATSGLVLRLDGERDGLFLGKPVPRPQPFEQVESEIAPQRLLDHVALAFAATRGFHLDGATTRASGHYAVDVMIARRWRFGSG